MFYLLHLYLFFTYSFRLEVAFVNLKVNLLGKPGNLAAKFTYF